MAEGGHADVMQQACGLECVDTTEFRRERDLLGMRQEEKQALCDLSRLNAMAVSRATMVVAHKAKHLLFARQTPKWRCGENIKGLHYLFESPDKTSKADKRRRAGSCFGVACDRF
jgi:hypothetical protein